MIELIDSARVIQSAEFIDSGDLIHALIWSDWLGRWVILIWSI